MNVFVLGTGRCGTMTFAKACSHITNYTSAHESRARDWRHRLTYPDRHIEVDHRLSWFLGTLDILYGDDAFYVHLRRDPARVAESWAARRNPYSQQRTWEDVVMFKPQNLKPIVAAQMMIQTVTDNINLFLRDKMRWVECRIENPDFAFKGMWEMIGAKGDLSAALDELKVIHNKRGTGRR